MRQKYIHTETIHNLKTPKLIAPMILETINPSSILDVGCGLGTWLKAFEDLGIKDILGVDGDWVDRELLKILPNQFAMHDLTLPFDLKRKFDLVISLEVAEHLDVSASEQFVQTLVNHGELILFSAAIPGQGGQNHINEKWLSVWADIFKRHNYILIDFLRPRIWSNPAIEVWYKQNIVLLCKEHHPLIVQLKHYHTPYLDIVHPDLFSYYHAKAVRSIQFEEGKLGIQLAMSAFVKAVINKFK